MRTIKDEAFDSTRDYIESLERDCQVCVRCWFDDGVCMCEEPYWFQRDAALGLLLTRKYIDDGFKRLLQDGGDIPG
jgi:hypothetical protein